MFCYISNFGITYNYYFFRENLLNLIIFFKIYFSQESSSAVHKQSTSMSAYARKSSAERLASSLERRGSFRGANAVVEARSVEGSNLASLTQQQKQETHSSQVASSSVRKSSSLAMESATSSSALASSSLSSKTAALVAEASNVSSTSMQQQSAKVSHHQESTAMSSMTSKTSTANIRKVSSQTKLSSAEMSAQEAVEYHQDHRRRSISTERMSKSVAMESNAIKSLSSHTENVSEESRLSSAHVHEGRVASKQLEMDLGSGSAVVVDSDALAKFEAVYASAEGKIFFHVALDTVLRYRSEL